MIQLQYEAIYALNVRVKYSLHDYYFRVVCPDTRFHILWGFLFFYSEVFSIDILHKVNYIHYP